MAYIVRAGRIGGRGASAFVHAPIAEQSGDTAVDLMIPVGGELVCGPCVVPDPHLVERAPEEPLTLSKSLDLHAETQVTAGGVLDPAGVVNRGLLHTVEENL